MTSLRRRVIGLGCAFVILGGALSAGGLWAFGGTIGIWGIIASFSLSNMVSMNFSDSPTPMTCGLIIRASFTCP